MPRPDTPTYMLGLAQAAARRATCPRLHVGAVVALGGELVATGYNGSLPGEDHCDDVGCLIHDSHCLRTIHAESNALRQVKPGVDLRQCTMYCTHLPCFLCLKEVLARGIATIYYLDPYRPDLRRSLFLASLANPPRLVQQSAPRLVFIDTPLLLP